MQDKVTLHFLVDAEERSTKKARENLAVFKERLKKEEMVEITFDDVNNTVLSVLKSKYDEHGEEFYRKKYRKSLSLKKKEEVIDVEDDSGDELADFTEPTSSNELD